MMMMMMMMLFDKLKVFNISRSGCKRNFVGKDRLIIFFS